MDKLPSNYCQIFSDLNKAIDLANWLNFRVRMHECRPYYVVGKEGNCAVISDDVQELFDEPTHPLEKEYESMSFAEIRSIVSDDEPLKHWAELRGAFSTMDGELLRYILAQQIPLEKFIRHELASRGYDENHQWCGFEKAYAIWCDNQKKPYGKEGN